MGSSGRTGRTVLRWLPLTVLLALLAGLAGAGGQHAPAQAQAEVHLTVAGDYGARATTDAVLRTVAKLAPDAHFAVGDLAYRDIAPERAWCSYVQQRVGTALPFEVLAGNHESSDVADGAIAEYAACLPNRLPGLVGTYGTQYAVDLPAAAPLARVIAVSPYLTFGSTRWDYRRGDARYSWLSARIDEARAKGIRWILVAAHVPCLSVGGYACPAPRDFVDLLMAKKVDLVLTGHEHAYLRTHQLRAAAAGCATLTVGSTNTACIADRDNSYAAGAGTVWATVGTGGIPLRTVHSGDGEAGYFAAFAGANRSPSYGVLDLRITADRLSASFVPSQGTLADRFTVARGSTGASTGGAGSGTSAAADTFSRSVAGGWGTAETGGPWTTTGSATVGSGAGRLRLGAPGSGAAAWLPGATSTSTDLQLRLSTDRAPTGGGVSAGVVVRRTGPGTDYRAGVRLTADGSVALSVRRVVGGTEAVLARAGAAGPAPAPGGWLRVRVQAVGADPTTVRVKAWRDGTAEPAGWAVQTTDATAGLQAGGSIGLTGYLSSSATDAPLVLAVDDVSAGRR
jgi:hypothetical protein